MWTRLCNKPSDDKRSTCEFKKNFPKVVCRCRPNRFHFVLYGRYFLECSRVKSLRVTLVQEIFVMKKCEIINRNWTTDLENQLRTINHQGSGYWYHITRNASTLFDKVCGLRVCREGKLLFENSWRPADNENFAQHWDKMTQFQIKNRPNKSYSSRVRMPKLQLIVYLFSSLSWFERKRNVFRLRFLYRSCQKKSLFIIA